MQMTSLQKGRILLWLLAGGAFALALLLAVDLFGAARRRAQLPSVTAAVAATDSAVPRPPWPADESFWNHFRAPPSSTPTPGGTLANRYRLAGVFRILSDASSIHPGRSCAILDDLKNHRQLLLAQDESDAGIRVEQVGIDYVVLTDGVRRERLAIAAGTLDLPVAASATSGVALAASGILSTNRFGNRLSETRWEFRRDAIMEYYQEMMDNPERLVGLFNAMEPARNERGKITGYVLNTALGESDFYTQMGLQQGDVVRRVNSLHMTSQKRAEYFIGEFVQGRLNAVVLDIDRGGKPEKLVYLVK